MSAYSEKPPKEEIKLRSTGEARTFKKTSTVSDRPPTTDHDFHKDVMDDPPHNVPGDAEVGGTMEGMKVRRKSDIEAEEHGEAPLGLYDEDDVGRKKPLDVQTELIDTSESTSRA